MAMAEKDWEKDFFPKLVKILIIIKTYCIENYTLQNIKFYKLMTCEITVYEVYLSCLAHSFVWKWFPSVFRSQ